RSGPRPARPGTGHDRPHPSGRPRSSRPDDESRRSGAHRLPRLPSRITYRAVHSPRLVILADARHAAAPADDETALPRFLDIVPREGDTLLLAGDIFDFWFSYRRLIPRRNFRVTAALTTLARRIPVAMIGGNHDRWGDSFWQDDAGILFDPHRLDLHV